MILIKFPFYYDGEGEGGGSLLDVDRTKTEYDQILGDMMNNAYTSAAGQYQMGVGFGRALAEIRRDELGGIDQQFQTLDSQALGKNVGSTAMEYADASMSSSLASDWVTQFMKSANEIELSTAEARLLEGQKPLMEYDMKIAALQDTMAKYEAAGMVGTPGWYEMQQRMAELARAREMKAQELQPQIDTWEQAIDTERQDIQRWGDPSLKYQIGNALAKGEDASILDKMMYKWSEDIAGSYTDIAGQASSLALHAGGAWLASVLAAPLTGGASLLVNAAVQAAAFGADFAITRTMRENETYAELKDAYDSRLEKLSNQKMMEKKILGQDPTLSQAEIAALKMQAFDGWDEMKEANMNLQYLDMIGNMLVKAPVSKMFSQAAKAYGFSAAAAGMAVGKAADIWTESIEEGLQYAYQQNYVDRGDNKHAWNDITFGEVLSDLTYGGTTSYRLRADKDYVDAVESVVAGGVMNLNTVAEGRGITQAAVKQYDYIKKASQLAGLKTQSQQDQTMRTARMGSLLEAVLKGDSGFVVEAMRMRAAMAPDKETRQAYQESIEEVLAMRTALDKMNPTTLMGKALNANMDAKASEKVEAVALAFNDLQLKRAQNKVNQVRQELESFVPTSKDKNKAEQEYAAFAQQKMTELYQAVKHAEVLTDGLSPLQSLFTQFTDTMPDADVKEGGMKVQGAEMVNQNLAKVEDMLTKLEQQDNIEMASADIASTVSIKPKDDASKKRIIAKLSALKEKLTKIKTKQEKPGQVAGDIVDKEAVTDKQVGLKHNTEPITPLDQETLDTKDVEELNNIINETNELINDEVLAASFVNGTREDINKMITVMERSVGVVASEVKSELQALTSGQKVKKRRTSARKKIKMLRDLGLTSGQILAYLKERLKKPTEKPKTIGQGVMNKIRGKNKQRPVYLNDNVAESLLDSLFEDKFGKEKVDEKSTTLLEYKKMLADEEVRRAVSGLNTQLELRVNAVIAQYARLRQAIEVGQLDQAVEILNQLTVVPKYLHDKLLSDVRGISAPYQNIANMLTEILGEWDEWISEPDELIAFINNRVLNNPAINAELGIDINSIDFTKEEAVLGLLKAIQPKIEAKAALVQNMTNKINASDTYVFGPDKVLVVDVETRMVQAIKPSEKKSNHILISDPGVMNVRTLVHSVEFELAGDNDSSWYEDYVLYHDIYNFVDKKKEELKDGIDYSEDLLSSLTSRMARLGKHLEIVKYSDKFTKEQKQKITEKLNSYKEKIDTMIANTVKAKQAKEVQQIKIHEQEQNHLAATIELLAENLAFYVKDAAKADDLIEKLSNLTTCML